MQADRGKRGQSTFVAWQRLARFDAPSGIREAAVIEARGSPYGCVIPAIEFSPKNKSDTFL